MLTETRAGRLLVLDPTVEAAPVPVAMAPRVASLAGTRVGLLENAKPNAVRLLDFVAELLRERHGVGEVVRAGKPNASRVAAREVLDELAECCDVVVTAIGD